MENREGLKIFSVIISIIVSSILLVNYMGSSSEHDELICEGKVTKMKIRDHRHIITVNEKEHWIYKELYAHINVNDTITIYMNGFAGHLLYVNGEEVYKSNF